MKNKINLYEQYTFKLIKLIREIQIMMKRRKVQQGSICGSDMFQNLFSEDEGKWG